MRLSAAQVERHIITLTNKKRRKVGAQPVRHVRLIRDVARRHAKDMVRRHYYDHDTKGSGLKPWQRGLRAELRVALSENIGNVRWAPPILIAGRSYVRIPRRSREWAVATAFVRQWMDSPSHHDKMLDGKFNEIGIGICIDYRTGEIYGVMNLAHRPPPKSMIRGVVRGILEHILYRVAGMIFVLLIVACGLGAVYVYEQLNPIIAPAYEALVPVLLPVYEQLSQVLSAMHDVVMQTAAPIIDFAQNVF